MARTQYCDVTDVRNMNSKFAGTDTVVTDAIISGYIDDACDLIDSRLYNLYEVPFTTTPLVVATIAKNLALYDTLKGVYSISTPEMSSWLESYSRKGNELLNKLEDGKIPLIDTSGDKVGNRGSAGLESTTNEYKPIFNQGDDVGWEISETRIEDEKKRYA